MRLLCILTTVLSLVLPATQLVQAQHKEKPYSKVLLASVTVDRDQAYEKEQVLLTVKVGIPFNAFNLTESELVVVNAEITSLHKKEFIESYQDTPYQFEQTVFAIFANKAGELTIPPLRFRATLPVASGGPGNKRNPEITATTEPLKITINSALETGDRWLTAKDVQISADWAGATDSAAAVTLQTGEPRTRHIYINIDGQHPAAIPPLTQPTGAVARSYPDLPKIEVTPTEQGLTGTLTQSVAFIANEPGSITLPEIAIKWWHIDERRWKVARLAGQKTEVLPGSKSDQFANPEAKPDYRNTAATLAIIAMIMATVIAALCLKLKRVTPITAHRTGQPLPLTEAQAWSRLQRSIVSADPAKIRESVLQWRNSCSQPATVTRLDQIGNNNQPLRQQLRQIDRALYRPAQEDLGQSSTQNHGIDLKLLRKALRLERKLHKDTHKGRQSPTELYPLT